MLDFKKEKLLVDIFSTKDNMFKYDSSIYHGMSEIYYAQLAGRVSYIKENYPDSDIWYKYKELFLYPMGFHESDIEKIILNDTTTTIDTLVKPSCCGGGQVK